MEDLKIIYVHLSPAGLPFSDELDLSNFTYNTIPPYTYVSIAQTKKATNIEPILLTNDSITDYREELIEFFNICKIGFPSFYKDSFWLLTFLRLYVLFLYVKKNNIKNFIHIENDNLIYQDTSIFSNLLPDCYFTKVGPYCGSSGLMFCNSVNKFEHIINKMLFLIKKGEKTVQKYTSYDFLSEMILIDLLVQANIAKYLPLFPEDEFFNLTNCVFDGASYGQYVGGTNNGNGPGWYGLNHFVGQKLHNKEITISFTSKIPTVTQNNITANIFNLHLHSKKLTEYV